MDIRSPLVVLVVAWIVVWRVLPSTDRVATIAAFVLAAVTLGNLAFAVVSVRRVTLQVVRHPIDALVDDMVTVELEVGGSRLPLRMRMHTSPDAPWVVVTPPGIVGLPGPAHFRGVAREAGVTVLSSGPLGLLGYTRPYLLPLGQPLFIGPRAVAPDEAVEISPHPGTADALSEIARARDDGWLVRGVREYRPGDPLRRVAWSVTARTGELATKELEETTAPIVDLVVDLGPEPGNDGEHAASVAAWVGLQVLAREWQLRVTVHTEDGLVVAIVDALGLQRALAAATFGPPPLVSVAGKVRVSPAGVSWG